MKIVERIVQTAARAAVHIGCVLALLAAGVIVANAPSMMSAQPQPPKHDDSGPRGAVLVTIVDDRLEAPRPAPPLAAVRFARKPNEL